MRIFKYWAYKKEHHVDPEGNALDLKAWAGSNLSFEAAQLHASTRMASWSRKVNESIDAFWNATDYPYQQSVLREECLEGHPEEDSWRWAITRNRYGAQVLNSSNLAILDLDRRPQGLWGWLTTVGRSNRHLDTKVRRRLAQWLAISPEVSLRLYATPNGFRALLTHRAFSPTDPDLYQLMKEIGVDPLYARLCRVQECFRARLTPKPWRIGCRRASWMPLAEGEVRAAHERNWLAHYEAKSAGYAACAYLETLGSRGEAIALEVADQVALHDGRSSALSGKPMA